jgi:hypothetical protein
MINRSEVNRALAKAIAYKQCGKDRDATIWAAKLVRLLECAEILNDDLRPLGSVESENTT